MADQLTIQAPGLPLQDTFHVKPVMIAVDNAFADSQSTDETEAPAARFAELLDLERGLEDLVHLPERSMKSRCCSFNPDDRRRTRPPLHI